MEWFEKILTLVAPAVVVLSIVASAVNAAVRTAQDKGKKVPGWILWVAGALNFLSVNLDKAWQQFRGGRGPAAPKP